MAVVEDYYIGNTHIIINDDYFCPPEEIPKILDRIGKKASQALAAATWEKEQKEKSR